MWDKKKKIIAEKNICLGNKSEKSSTDTYRWEVAVH